MTDDKQKESWWIRALKGVVRFIVRAGTTIAVVWLRLPRLEVVMVAGAAWSSILWWFFATAFLVSFCVAFATWVSEALVEDEPKPLFSMTMESPSPQL